MEKNLNLDVMRAIAIGAVVLIHGSMNTFYMAPIDSVAWNITNLCYSLSRFCVPLFFMISAFLLIKEDMDVRAFLRRRLTRIALPFLAWSLIYGILNGEDIFSRHWLVDVVINHNAMAQLWFLYALIGLYLLMPLVSLIYYKGGRTFCLFYTVLTFLFSCTFPFLSDAFKITISFVGNMALNNFNAYVIFLFLPLLIKDIGFTRQRGWLALGLFILAVIVMFTGTRSVSLAAHAARETYYTYFYPPTVVASAALFYLMLNARFTFSPLIKQRLTSVAECSFGIFLAHMVVYLAVTRLININEKLIWPFASLLFSGVMFGITYLAVRYLRKLPYIRALF
ncbi:acyltransferase family protein [Chimaeribacter arupi]|uniref:acyltransferase n=1 Tax=Chimaeribacter arupi TaxID=2060066 RepID=UPI002711FEB4|nr:acyltransferase family protein [Chimaeribacter arupi]WKZ93865.1 acyltransferase family protein [Chimaeribacter arupi]